MTSTVHREGIVEGYLRRSKADIPDLTAERVQGSVPGYVYRGKEMHRYRPRRKVSPFNIILLLFGFAVASVLYVGNIIAVNSLAREVNRLEREYEQIRNSNEILRAELNSRTSLEQIGSEAIERLGLENPKAAPKWISIDKSDVERLQRELRRSEK